MILFFDTETTGLPRNYKASYRETNNWPRIVQLSWLIADNNSHIIKESDNIIQPEGFHIPIEASKVHGITDEIANEKGKNLTAVLQEFLKDIYSSELLVCHNMGYDMPVLQCELFRKELNPNITTSQFCTMRETTSYCNLPGYYGPKWPKLEELYYKCFNRKLENAHNAMDDVRATYSCYFHLEQIGIFG